MLVHRPHEPAGTGLRVAPPVALQILEANDGDRPGAARSHRRARQRPARFEPGFSVVHRYCDSLFPGGPGTTAGPAEFTSLMDDLEERIFGALPDETWVYPGHGKDTTLGAERPHLAEWRARGW